MPDSTSLAWSWNARKQPVNPYAVDVPARKPSALAVWIALYEQDKSDQREQAEAMSRAAEEYLFSVAHCDPWHYDELNDALCGEVIVYAWMDRRRENSEKPYGARLRAGRAVSARLVGK